MLQEKAGNIAGLIWNALSEAQSRLDVQANQKSYKTY